MEAVMGTLSKTVVHVKVGGQFDDGQPPWIPGGPELENVRNEWQEALGDEYVVIATHSFVEAIFYDEVECSCG
jgi:hypothetical protein